MPSAGVLDWRPRLAMDELESILEEDMTTSKLECSFAPMFPRGEEDSYLSTPQPSRDTLKAASPKIISDGTAVTTAEQNAKCQTPAAPCSHSASDGSNCDPPEAEAKQLPRMSSGLSSYQVPIDQSMSLSNLLSVNTQRDAQIATSPTSQEVTEEKQGILETPRSPSEALDDQMWPLSPELAGVRAAKEALKGMQNHALLAHLMHSENELIVAGVEALEDVATKQLDLPDELLIASEVQGAEDRSLSIPLEMRDKQIATGTTGVTESQTLQLAEPDDDWNATVASAEQTTSKDDATTQTSTVDKQGQSAPTQKDLGFPSVSTVGDNPPPVASKSQQPASQAEPVLLQRGGVPSIPPRYFHREVTEVIIQTWLTGKPSAGQYPRVVIVGMGGLGKTATAVGAAHKAEVLNRFAGCIIWTQVGAQGQTEMERVVWLQELYMKVVVFLGNQLDRLLGGEEFVHSACEELFLARINNLLFGRRCLLIFDDVQLDAMMAVIMKLQCAVLMTTQSLPAGVEFAQCKIVPMRALTAGESHQLMISIVGLENNRLHDLEIGCSGHPFALSLAGALYRRKMKRAAGVAETSSVKNLLQRLKEPSNRFMTSVSPSETLDLDDETRYAALIRNLNAAVDSLDKRERSLYIMLAVLPPGQYAPIDMLQSLWGLPNIEETGEILDTMNRLSLLQRQYTWHSLAASWWGMHDLQLDHVRGLAAAEGLQELMGVAKQRQLAYLSQLGAFMFLVRTVGMLKLIAFWGQVASPSVVSSNYLRAVQSKMEECQGSPGDVDANLSRLLEMKLKKRNRFRIRRDMDMAVDWHAVSGSKSGTQDQTDIDALVLMKLGSFLQIIEEYDASKQFFSHALAVIKKLQPEDHSKTAIVFNAVGRILLSEKNFELAERFYRKAYDMYKSICGKDHPEVIALLSSLGGVLKSLGSFDEAETIYMKTIELRSQKLGANHQDVATSMNDLAMVYCNQGRFDEAAVHHKMALDIRRDVFGVGHPSVAVSLSNLAVVLRTQGNFHEAEVLHRQALRIKEQLFGRDHPETAVSLNNLGVVLSDQGQFDQAETMHRKAIEILSASFGDDHPDVAVSLNNLALVMRKTRKNSQEVEALHRRDLEISMRAYGEDHPDVALSLNNLALVLSDQGKLEEAKSLHHKALEIRKRVFGEEHPTVAVSLSNLAGVLEKQGDLQEAEELHRRDLEISRKTLGEEHPSVACSMNNLAEVLRMQGNFKEAAQLHRKDLEITSKVYGDHHPSVAVSLNNLAGVLKDQGNLSEAEQLYRRALDIKMKVYGEGHPDVAITLRSLAALEEELGNMDEAESLHHRSLQIRTMPYGGSSAHVSSSLRSLELMLSAQHSSRLQRSFIGKVVRSFGLCLGKSLHIKPDNPAGR